MERLLREMRSLFAVDLRSLALFRIALALLVLVDLAMRARDLTAFYSEAGVLPVADLALLQPRAELFSIHVHASGSPLALAGLFALSAVAALAMLTGFQTRVATVVTWYLLASLQARNPWLAAMGGDKLLRVFLFWACLLPLGARFSIDAARNPRLRDAGNRYESVASAALLVQVALVYFATGWLKQGPRWLDGTAVFYALHLDYYATPFGVWLREHAGPLLPLSTYGVRWFEMLGPLLAFSPWATGPLRTLAVLLFAVLHAVLAAALDIGLFPAFSMAGWLAFLPGWFWDRALPRLRGGAEAPPRKGAPLRRFWPLELAAGAMFVYVVVTLGSSTFGVRNPLPGPVHLVGTALRMNHQHWSMFADAPDRDYWPVLVGERADGARVDTLTSESVSFEPPPSVAALFPSWGWRAYFSNLIALSPQHTAWKRVFADFARVRCREWNRTHAPADRIESLELWVVTERTTNSGPGEPDPAKVLRQYCDEP